MSKRSVLAAAATLFCIILFSSCGDSNDCITCRLSGAVDSICEDEIDQYNLLNGTNVTSLSQIEAIVEVAGGSCE